MRTWTWATGAALLALTGCARDPEPLDPESMLEAVVRHLGAPYAPVALHYSGTLDKWAEGQGWAPDGPSPGPVVEILRWHPSGSVSRWYREDRFDGTHERFGESYPDDTTRVYRIDDAELLIPFVSDEGFPTRDALARRFPWVLAEEAAMAATSAKAAVTPSGDTLHASLELGDGTRIDLLVRDTLLVGVKLPATLPGRGEVTLRWEYDAYRDVAWGRIPSRVRAFVGPRPYVDLTLDSVTTGDDVRSWTRLDGLRTLSARRVSGQTAPPAPLTLDTLAEGVYRVPGVRSGFAPLVVEVSPATLAVVDAPASFPLLGTIPPDETDAGPSMSWASERLIAYLTEALPGRQVGWVVLTHHHEDHTGGVRAFVAEGATVVAAPATRPVVERLVALEGVADRLGETPRPLSFQAVEGALVLGEGRLEVRAVGENPHAEGLLVVGVPHAGILYVSDVATPGDPAGYPQPPHAPLDRWLADWVDHQGVAFRRLYGMHGQGYLTPERLAALRR